MNPADERPQPRESVWARISRDDGDYAHRARRPLTLFWIGLMLVNVPNLARLVVVDLPAAASIGLLLVGATMGLVGFVQSRRVRRHGA